MLSNRVSNKEAISTFKLVSLESLNLLCDDRKLLQNEKSFVIVLTDEDDDKTTW